MSYSCRCFAGRVQVLLYVQVFNRYDSHHHCPSKRSAFSAYVSFILAGWDWGQDLPSATSALLQAVEVAAAAEPGDALLPSPPSWKRQHRDACLPSLHTTALQDQAGITTAAVAAPASLLAVASDARSHLPEQTAGDPDIRLGANVATSSSFDVGHSQAPLPVFRPAVRRPSQQDFTMATLLPEQASKGAQVANRADAEGAVQSTPFQGLASAPSLNASGCLVRSPLADQVWHWEQQAKSDSNLAAGSLHPGQGEQPNNMMPVLQSPFAAIAALPMYQQPIQTAAAQAVPLASASERHLAPQVPSPLTDAEAAAQAAIQARLPYAQGSLLGQANIPQQQKDHFGAQKLHRETPLSGLGKKAQPTLRLPLSPSCVRSNGEASVLQPLARAHARSLHHGSGLHSSTSKPQSLHHLRDCKLGSKASQPVCHSELLPGRNVVVTNAGGTDLAHLLVPPSQWCW